MEPIFIPTKKRVNNCSFVKLCQENNIPAILVVEKEDADGYREAYPKFNYIVLPESNRGITYVRNYIKQHAEDEGLKHYWMFDDDVTGLYERVAQKMIKRTGFGLLEMAEEQLKQMPGLGIGALEYQQLAWSATKPAVENSFCDVAVFINNDLTRGLRYREYVEGKEDRDFAMQVIKAGLKTARSTLYAFAAPKNGSNAGGLKETFYDRTGREELCATRMVELWGEDVCQKFVKPDGRHDVKIHWKRINSGQASLF